jgi:hypothetical protein
MTPPRGGLRTELSTKLSVPSSSPSSCRQSRAQSAGESRPLFAGESSPQPDRPFGPEPGGFQVALLTSILSGQPATFLCPLLSPQFCPQFGTQPALPFPEVATEGLAPLQSSTLRLQIGAASLPQHMVWWRPLTTILPWSGRPRGCLGGSI